MKYVRSACVFCGGSPLVAKKYMDVARKLGNLLASKQIELVYGGANAGLMGAISNGAMEKKGRVLGFLPEDLLSIEDGNTEITQLTIVADMHERKRNMYIHSDVFIALPGGFGTLEELFEVMTYKAVGFFDKPIIVLNTDGYWDPLIKILDNIYAEKFADVGQKNMYSFVNTPEEVIDLLVKKDEKQEFIQKIVQK
ncbi:MAG: TIGR00730 family Rossman fold protein [Proteobacteria bacterium]|nr:TIGR00730 family Rossman fold protein [Pseudomonadota bacterium]